VIASGTPPMVAFGSATIREIDTFMTLLSSTMTNWAAARIRIAVGFFSEPPARGTPARRGSRRSIGRSRNGRVGNVGIFGWHARHRPCIITATAMTPPPGGASRRCTVSQAATGGGTRGVASVVPVWLANLASLGWRLLAIAGFAAVMWLLAQLLWTVTAAIAVAIVVAALFAPWTLALRKRGRSRSVAAAIVWAGAIAAVAGVLFLLALAFLPYVADVIDRLSTSIALLGDKLAALELPPFLVRVIQNLADGIKEGVSAGMSGVTSSAAGTVTVFILATFLVFFFLRDGDKAWQWCFQAADDAKRARITAAGEEALGRVGGYLRGTTVLSGVIALTDLVFMVLLGVPLAGPLAVLVFLSGYIPYFGGIVTTALIVAVTYGTQGTVAVLILLVLIAIRNAFLGYWVRPLVYGRAVSIHPALVLLALPAGFQLAGVVGLFAAVPVTAVIFAVARAVVAVVEPDPKPPLPELVPAWLDRMAQWSWRMLVGVALLYLVVVAFGAVPMVLIPIVLSVILAATFEPVVRWLIGRGRSRAQASAIAVGGGLLAIVAALVFSLAILLERGSALATGVSDGADSTSGALGGHLKLVVDAVHALANGGLQTVIGIASAAASMAAIVVLSALVAFYLLRDGSRLWSATLARTRPDVRDRVAEAGAEAFGVLGGYMFGTAVISLVGAASQLVIMLLLGIPLAVPVFVLSFFLCFIPYVGGFVSTGAALLLTIAVGSTADIAIMGVWTVLFNLITGNVVGPVVYGKTVHLHPAVVLVAIPAGSAVAGVLGMFLVVPVLGVVAVTWRTVLAVMAVRAEDAAGLGGGDLDAGGGDPVMVAAAPPA
jgi:predicted PurR-regulated permease PerM